MEPEFRIRVLFQSGVQRPASKCALERVTLASNRPARTSCSIFRSHWSARNSSNHSEKRESSSAERRETTDSSSSTLMILRYSPGHQIQRKHLQESATAKLPPSARRSPQAQWGMLMPRCRFTHGHRMLDPPKIPPDGSRSKISSDFSAQDCPSGGKIKKARK
jgi:hypothetical protein